MDIYKVEFVVNDTLGHCFFKNKEDAKDLCKYLESQKVKHISYTESVLVDNDYSILKDKIHKYVMDGKPE